jgi:hypothetical protein
MDAETLPPRLLRVQEIQVGEEHACVACCNTDRFSCYVNGVFGDAIAGAQAGVNNVKRRPLFTIDALSTSQGLLFSSGGPVKSWSASATVDVIIRRKFLLA